MGILLGSWWVVSRVSGYETEAEEGRLNLGPPFSGQCKDNGHGAREEMCSLEQRYQE
jgi:hypothetical protein